MVDLDTKMMHDQAGESAEMDSSQQEQQTTTNSFPVQGLDSFDSTMVIGHQSESIGHGLTYATAPDTSRRRITTLNKLH